MSNAPRIAVVGSLNTDLTTFSDRFPRAGETLFGTSFDLGFGGKGANQAVAAKLCGAEVAMVGKVGRDVFGEAVVKNLSAYGVDVTNVTVADGVSTGVAPIFVEPNGQNRIIVVKGANDQLKPADIDTAAPRLRMAQVIILQFEVPLETIYYTVNFAVTHGIRCIVNPAPALAADLSKLRAADYFIPNETEAEMITGLPTSTLDETKACASSMLQQGFRRVLITLGARGSLLADSSGTLAIAPHAVTAVDTSGAGDAFIGSFAAFLGEGLPERDAAARASLYAALSTLSAGAQKSFANRQSFEAQWVARTA